jgi:hypothetical protein
VADANVTKLPGPPEKLPVSFQLGDTLIDGVIIKPLTFASFVEAIAAAQIMTEPKTFEARLRRLRLLRQVTFYAGNSQVAMSQENLLKMPIPVVHVITAHLDEGEGKPGKVIRDGDGIEKAIVYELGTPISGGQGKSPIKELEFQASTYGDIEDVLSVDTAIQQTYAMILTIAKPLGTTLSLLPSWAANTITVADGVMMSRDILPRFLGSPDE